MVSQLIIRTEVMPYLLQKFWIQWIFIHLWDNRWLFTYSFCQQFNAKVHVLLVSNRYTSLSLTFPSIWSFPSESEVYPLEFSIYLLIHLSDYCFKAFYARKCVVDNWLRFFYDRKLRAFSSSATADEFLVAFFFLFTYGNGRAKLIIGYLHYRQWPWSIRFCCFQLNI